MVVPGIVNTVAGQKVQDATAVFREQLATETALILDVHVQEVEQGDPLRVNVVVVVRGAGGGGGRHPG
jgi:chemotaxis response regulator CheB